MEQSGSVQPVNSASLLSLPFETRHQIYLFLTPNFITLMKPAYGRTEHPCPTTECSGSIPLPRISRQIRKEFFETLDFVNTTFNLSETLCPPHNTARYLLRDSTWRYESCSTFARNFNLPNTISSQIQRLSLPADLYTCLLERMRDATESLPKESRGLLFPSLSKMTLYNTTDLTTYESPYRATPDPWIEQFGWSTFFIALFQQQPIFLTLKIPSHGSSPIRYFFQTRHRRRIPDLVDGGLPTSTSTSVVSTVDIWTMRELIVPSMYTGWILYETHEEHDCEIEGKWVDGISKVGE